MVDETDVENILNNRSRLINICNIEMKNFDIGETIDEVIQALNELKSHGCTHVSYDDDYLRGSVKENPSKEEIIKYLEQELKFCDNRIGNIRSQKESLTSTLILVKNMVQIK